MRKAAKFSDPPRTLRESLYQMVHHSGVDIDVQAEQIRIKPKTLYNYANPNLEEDGYNYPLFKLSPHMRLTENLVVLRYFAHEHGCALLPVMAKHKPDVSMPAIRTPEAILRQLGRVSKEFAQFTTATLKAVEDGRVTPHEAHRSVNEGWDMVEQTAVLMHELKAIMERTP